MRSLTLVAPIVLATSAIVFAGNTIELAQGFGAQRPQQPQVAVDDNGSIHVVFGRDSEIHYCRSDDGGRNFTAPVTLPSVLRMSLGMRRGPRIAVTEGIICVTAIGGEQGKGRDGDLLALRSTDGGKSWTAPVAVNDAPASAREGLHAMAASRTGLLCCVWLDLRNNQTEVMMSASTDGGKTWGANKLVYRSPEGSVCECCHPSVAFDRNDRIFVQWRNSLAGARDMYVASSTDDGKHFGKAEKLGKGTWMLNTCPMDGGAIGLSADGRVATVWRREKAVFVFEEGAHDERLIGTGEQPSIAVTDDGPVIVWLQKRGGAVNLLSPDATTPVELGAHAYDPVIAAGPLGRGPVVAAWESHETKSYTIQCRVVVEK